MPTYDYVCKECEFTFEEFQPISANPLTDCPHCGKPSLRRKMGTGAGMIFKGSGFYLTDYVRKNGGSSSTPSSGTDSTSGPSPGTSQKGNSSSSATEKSTSKSPDK
ncbi:MAG: zinc ribbon domain-containing protein [Ignavibacteria bacterium]|nr:zinc ribbon domain-containing protein [Ignavibacteria bacterium]